MINDLSAFTRPVALVIDDYHLTETGAIHEAVAFLLEYLHGQAHVLFWWVRYSVSLGADFTPGDRWITEGPSQVAEGEGSHL